MLHLKSTGQRGVTLFESLVTLLLLFVVLSSVVSLLQSSLRAAKGQQGRAISEIAFVQEMIRRDLADALTVSVGDGTLSLSRHNHTVAWQELLTMSDSPATIRPITVSYQFVEGKLHRSGSLNPTPEPLVALEAFESTVRETDVRVSMRLKAGQRVRTLIWNFWCRAL